ncbi:MAG: prephenate dehydrogenase [Prevotellaceae bacterium]|jgi:prephenate dehydrogenase|nr:prephenate dehydrogenase [Prevotellaceae bacterium]
MKTAIIGVGLIGGSFALSLRKFGLSNEILGVDSLARHSQKALELGLINKIVTLEQATDQADLIVLATPADTLPLLAVKVLNKIGNTQVVMDMGSIKTELCEVMAQHPARGRFVATHPMWGTEFSGPQAAVADGFTGRTVVICNREESDSDALQLVEQVYTTIGMPIKYMNGEEQDLHSAYISHISHITSFALALTVLEKEREEEHIFDLAGGGFESTVRLAKSSARTWAPIFMQNKYNVLDVLREHIHQLQIFRKLLEKEDEKGLVAVMEKANTIGRILP